MAPPGTGTSQTSPYRERLTVTWWLWLLGFAAAAALALEVWLGADGVRAWLPFAVLLPLTALGLWALGRIRVEVGPGPDGEDALLVDDAHLPVRFVSDVIPLDAEGRREILGVAADPLAFVVQRPWISGAVQVLLDDPADPTPYWVVSTRHPIALAQAVLDARGQREV
ncbi:DUF3093 domain-containing protein [Catenuloplanes indicus]|uniref:DUF3093 domain-containing protein n=1 Tax=Catenuloplanes indicus TaxID=137267 RepID=A0AAE3W473_9ACTN|nr:DUF3093 domain-containing protein [Catenuloplanes indicus]MDQ0369261.1 hypothetical protein [Catenuloplanes indicus]